MLRRQQLIQAFGELVIPLLGFFWLGWDLYFILLFYLLDIVATEVFYQLKLSKITAFQKVESSIIQRISTMGLVLLIGVLAHTMILRLYPELVFSKAFMDFLAYEEEGIPIAQGYLLLPLVVIGNYQQYKMFFLVPNRFRTLSVDSLYSSRRNALLAALGGIALVTSVLYFVLIPEIFVLLVFVTGKLWFDLKRSAL
jgi:hypothetical protein